MPRSATALGVFATLVTLACGWTVLASGDGDGDGPSRTALRSWQVVSSAAGTFEVPPEGSGWTVREPDQVLYYADRRGRPVVGVTGPAVFDDGYCGRSEEPSNRGFAGLTGPHSGTVRGVNVREARRWRTAVAGRPTTDGRTTRVLLADGSVAAYTHAVVRPATSGPCQADRVALDHVSVAGPAGVVALVVVRDLGPDAAPASVVDRVLRSLRAG